jgi:hypothetical protein
MKKLAIAALVLAVTTPALAAQSDANGEQDLRCAILAAYVAGTIKDAEAQKGLEYAMTYFVGRFEGSTGRKFEDVATVDYVNKLVPEIESLRQPCSERMKSFGERLTAWGAALQKSGDSNK